MMLKELSKPPFRYDSGTILDGNNHYVCRLQLWSLCFGEFIATAMNKEWEREMKSCENAGKTSDGKCIGYQKNRSDDEPAEMCKGCKENQFYEEDEP